jgi:hypothetical protein
MVKVNRQIVVRYRVIEGEPEYIADTLTFEGNLINSYGGRVYGTNYQVNSHFLSFIGSEAHWATFRSVLLSFELPIENLDAFLKEEKLRVAKSQSK